MTFKYGIILIVILCILFSILKIIKEIGKKNQKLLLEKIKKSEQQINRNMEQEKWSRISYFSNQNDELIDEITSNDLELCNLFSRMNYCMSSLGEEYLIHLLHNPCYDKEELKRREKIIRYYEEHDEERIRVKSLFAKIGKPRYVSLYEYMDILCDAPRRNIFKHYVSLIDIIISIVLMYSVGKLGLIVFIGSIIFNIVTYFMDKAYYDSYMYPMSFIEDILNFNYKIPNVLDKTMDDVKKALNSDSKELKKLFKFSKIVYSKDFMAGDIGELFMDNIRMLTHIDIIYFNYQMKSIGSKKDKLIEIMNALGYFESLVSVCTFRKTLTYYCVPNFINKKNELNITEIYHPLIETPVANSLQIRNSILLTGSNASGKSTFLKTIAINLIMAQTICTCTAKIFESSFYYVISSMALRDSLDRNESYYIAEIKAMKRIMDVDNNIDVFCLIDEILRGTNTVERIASAAHILKALKENNKLCIAATHDIELTYMLDEIYDNYHFCEICNDREVKFDYMLKQGRCENKNAIKLLEALGIDKRITHGAEETAKYFEKTNLWKVDM